MARIVILGGGPGGYEAALVAAQYGAEVTLIETAGIGGSCVLYDCVPSKTFIASAGGRTAVREAGSLGVIVDDDDITMDLPKVHQRVKNLAAAQSWDIRKGLSALGVTIIDGIGRFVDEVGGLAVHIIEAMRPDGSTTRHEADAVLVATGASPRILPSAIPDGERILTWRQVYDLAELPAHLVIVGSGVTGAEFASAYTEMGVKVTLISSRDRVLPHEDADAARVLESIFADRGVTQLKNTRAESVVRDGDEVVVTLHTGEQIRASHALMTVGSVPNTADLGLEKAGIVLGPGGFIPVDRVSRTSAAGVFAAGDCTGVLMLASVAAMQGRIAMWHFLGDGVPPLRLKTVSGNVFTHPEIANVGISQAEADAGVIPSRTLMLPLATNPRSKMTGLRHGFVKLFVRPATGIVIGGVVVAPDASELILPITMAVQNRLTAKNLAYSFSVYPSLSGSITELGRQLMHFDGDLG